ncbi:MAG: PBP1A family penicillin-binding protein [Hyphomicrobiaceae bacterium]|nr:PBP1A family penicillin-binding protein [Hyphomicrobiaceae bacterium]
MNDWFFKQGGRDRLIDWLGLDAWIDSTLAESWEWIKNGYDAASSFFARFRLTGWKRLLNEAASEGLSMAAGGFVVLYGLALPAFLEVEEGRWLTTGKYSVKFIDGAGSEIGKRGINLDDAVPLEEIPDHMVKATLATEDRRFYEHFGVDVFGTLRALVENLRANDVVQGGSSLSQQLAKNLFLSSERSLQRKIKEAFLALWLESRLSKNEILKLYLDRSYMGGGAFGVEAAAQFYFGKSIREINLAEAAMLAGLFKAPTKFAPHIDLAAARARANIVLTNLVEAGFYTAGQVHHARLNPARIVETRQASSPDWFLDFAYDEIQRIMEGKGHFNLTARTTIDLTLQQAGEQALVSTIRQRGRSIRADSGALVAMEPDGAVRVLVGGLDYGESQFNRATKAKRQPGSSFKVYVYAAALENGYKPDTVVRDASRSCGRWHPRNYNGGHGSGARMPLWMALARSLNTVAAELSFAVGREKVIELTQRLGVTGIRKTCSMALGDYGITPLEHTGGVATFANGGRRATPYAILEIYTASGELVYSRERDEPPAPQVVSRQVAEQMNQMLNKVVTEGTGTRAALEFTHVAGKTGTSTGPKDVWFVGYTGKYVGGVWLGNDDNRPMANGTTGGQMAAPVWHSFMSVAHTDMNIPTIPGLTPHPVQVAEQQRIAELRRNDGILAASAQAGAQRKGQASMPDQTREALKRIVQSLRKASGPAGAAPENKEPAGPAPGQLPGDRRADASTSLGRDSSRGRP